MTALAQKYVFVTALAEFGGSSKANFVLANPTFNDSNWRAELLKDDPRRVYRVSRAVNRILQPNLGPPQAGRMTAETHSNSPNSSGAPTYRGTGYCRGRHRD